MKYQLIIHYQFRTGSDGFQIGNTVIPAPSKKEIKNAWIRWFDETLKGKDVVYWTKYVVLGEVVEQYSRGV